MKPLNVLLPLLAGLLVALTYLVVQGAAPDGTQHERTLAALRAVILDNAALQRDVLRARGGMLHNYDPLVRSITSLRQATDRLPIAREATTGEGRADINRRVAEVAAAVSEQEALVEAFKSKNALLQNSLTYFNYTSGRVATAADGPHAAAVGILAAAMLRFVDDPRPEAAREVTILLDRLARLPVSAAQRTELGSLISHGRLIVAILPEVDDLVAGLQADATNEQALALQDAYLEAHGRATARAGVFQMLLYVAALALVAYIVYLFVRLRAKAQILRQRLAFEELIASISSQFINLPRDRIRDSISNGLRRLVEHCGLDGAQMIVDRAGEDEFARGYSYRNPTTMRAEAAFEDVVGLAHDWQLKSYVHEDCIQVPDVAALPQSRERAWLQARDIRSWLCISIRYAGHPLGFLVLDAVTDEGHWRPDDIARLRTAAEIFANAIARERNESEREALQARLNQSQRLEAIGTLAGGIAHEFNNILGAILGYGEMALGALRKESAARRHVGQIMKAGERARDVVEQVLAFGRRREREHRPVRVEPVIAEAVEMIRASMPATLSVHTDFKAGDASMMGDPTELQQVVINLATNAAQAMDSRGVVGLEVDTVERVEELRLSQGSLQPGRYIRLVVRDSGRGMDRATIERMFEPFFTTRPAGRGTGLGLSTVHGIVNERGGALNVSSRPGQGTTFEIYFPRMDGIAAVEDKQSEAPARRGHGQTILIVDDDKPLVLLGEEMLAALGYEPVGFDSSAAALAAFQADPQRFDLVLTDEVMPELTGIELAGALHQARPELPIVLMTGHGGAPQPERLHAAGIREMLRKPLLSRPMAASLARQLSHGRETPRETHRHPGG
jgi:signal transduction histidine kinase/ActR/RegA family two-component response regulator